MIAKGVAMSAAMTNENEPVKPNSIESVAPRSPEMIPNKIFAFTEIGIVPGNCIINAAVKRVPLVKRARITSPELKSPP